MKSLALSAENLNAGEKQSIPLLAKCLILSVALDQ